ncbi:MAG: DUF1826 domain-containing protein [Xanthomonadales bacterium]|nr:DUF1826 domain-containing protein [Xanthomonadales bacterium]
MRTLPPIAPVSSRFAALVCDEACEGFSAEVLRAIESGHAALAVWHEAVPHDALPAIEALRHGPPCSQRVRVPERVTDLALADFLHPFGYRAEQHGRLADFIATLLHVACDVIASRPLWLRLDRITDDGCRRFHVDYVQVRLLCTLIGPGTEWLPESAVDRTHLQDGSHSHVLDREATRRVPAGAVALLRGERHPLGGGVVHRSPPMNGAAPRLLLAIES